LNLGLNDVTVEALAKSSGDARFAYDSYRRFITMYSDVVLGVGHDHFEEILEMHKEQKAHGSTPTCTAEDWAELIKRYKARVKEETGDDFPQEPFKQLWGAIGAVFGSWMNSAREHLSPPAQHSGKLGNGGQRPGDGVRQHGRHLGDRRCVHAQSLDRREGAVRRIPHQRARRGRGRRHPHAAGDHRSRARSVGLDKPSMEKAMPDAYAELTRIYQSLEKHYRDMQDLEFTVEKGKLWMLQTRSGKRTAKAALRIAVELRQ
jgi:pyruvate,orthophosphate dikinase